jgi:ABC-type antimicrobial peptide transport system permease subunit
MRLGMIGVLFGIVAALAVSRLLTSVLFGVSATDPLAFLQALALVLAGVVLATLIPAFRACRTNVLDALHHN